VVFRDLRQYFAGSVGGAVVDDDDLFVDLYCLNAFDDHSDGIAFVVDRDDHGEFHGGWWLHRSIGAQNRSTSLRSGSSKGGKELLRMWETDLGVDVEGRGALGLCPAGLP